VVQVAREQVRIMKMTTEKRSQEWEQVLGEREEQEEQEVREEREATPSLPLPITQTLQ
jgi:hypothetical protein